MPLIKGDVVIMEDGVGEEPRAGGGHTADGCRWWHLEYMAAGGGIWSTWQQVVAGGGHSADGCRWWHLE